MANCCFRPPPSLLAWVCSRAKQDFPQLLCKVSEPQKDVFLCTKAHCSPKGWLLWHRDKMKSKASTFVSDSSFPH